MFATVTDAEHRAGVVDRGKLEAITERFAQAGHVTVGGVVRLRRLYAVTVLHRLSHDALFHFLERAWEARGPLGGDGHLRFGLPRVAPWV
jgi:hypothetical protein